MFPPGKPHKYELLLLVHRLIVPGSTDIFSNNYVSKGLCTFSAPEQQPLAIRVEK